MGKAASAVLCFMLAMGLSDDAYGNEGGALAVGPASFLFHVIMCIPLLPPHCLYRRIPSPFLTSLLFYMVSDAQYPLARCFIFIVGRSVFLLGSGGQE